MSLISSDRAVNIHQTLCQSLPGRKNKETNMKRLKANRFPLLALIVTVVSVTSLILQSATMRTRAASTIHVTTTADSGGGSLRQAITDAATGDTIDFNLSYPATITLTSGHLAISKNLTINGPGPNLLTVNGNKSSLILHIKSG